MLLLNILLTIIFESASPFWIALKCLYIAGVWKMLGKSGADSRWALVPCAREYMLSKCANRELDGRVLSVCQFFNILVGVLMFFRFGEIPHAFLDVLSLPLILVVLLFQIRVYSGLIEIYGARRRWMFIWLFFDGIAAFYWGFSPKFQPLYKVDELHRESLSIFSDGSALEMDQGLTINLEERSVLDFFQKKYLLRDIHFNVQPGRMVLLLGGSGAGKTTFLNAVNGYEKAKGNMTLNGTDIYGEYKKMQYEVGFVPQQELMRSKDTVYHTLADTALLRLPSTLSKADVKKRISDVMEIFGLTPVRNSLVEKLSGGQKKRLSIAMELLSNPSLFILDEPDSGLDGVMARELMEQLRKVADQGKIVIVITHTPDRVIDLFDDVIVLAKDSGRTGRLAFYGTIDEARAFFGRERMEQIVLCVNRKEEGGEGRADEFIAKYVEALNHG